MVSEPSLSGPNPWRLPLPPPWRGTGKPALHLRAMPAPLSARSPSAPVLARLPPGPAFQSARPSRPRLPGSHPDPHCYGSPAVRISTLAALSRSTAQNRAGRSFDTRPPRLFILGLCQTGPMENAHRPATRRCIQRFPQARRFLTKVRPSGVTGSATYTSTRGRAEMHSGIQQPPQTTKGKPP